MTAEDDDRVLVHVGPVDAGAALAWVDHELRNLRTLRRNAARLPFLVPDEVLDEIAVYLRKWRSVAMRAGVFEWSAPVARHRLVLLVRYWANLDVMTDELVAALGLAWAPPSTRPFFDALVDGVDRALRSAGGSPDPYARLLARPPVVPTLSRLSRS